ncbi:hypothetical protein SAMN04487943_1168 [Gracilibacillus orientalis]|uniref:RepB-like DNA primase domain-containing protein n=1 Tax=Gracilibacillus orientalis TaxID=334253 RepID=A0A1I4QDP8_9BACI|nr:hypothetical protein [Gracilibacillus orientalis]SFM38178.1 hypothetical protein SAMN04487943_1168 [Gracilibacillus orientalis]
MEVYKTEKFFRDVHRGKSINFRCINKKNVFDYNGLYNEKTKDILSQFNEQDYEIYFLVNSGGFKSKEITSYNSVFLDLDCGKDEEGNYMETKIVNDYKYKKSLELSEFEVPPSYIIETRNGYHVYWLLENGATAQDFMICQERLIEYFDGDPVVKNPNRLLRVPNYYWCKDKDSKFLVRTLQSEGHRYEIQHIISLLPKVKGSVKREKSTHSKKECNSFLSIEGTNPPAGSHIDLIINKDIVELQQLIKPKEVELTSHMQVYDYLKKQDLAKFLGLDGYNFNCIFHEDNTPSAGFVKNEETGHFIYNCLSSSCNVSYNIIQVIQSLTSWDTPECLTFLRKVFKVRYPESKWKQEREAALNENIKTVSSQEFGLRYKELNQFVTRYYDFFLLFHKITLDHIYTENFTDAQGNPVFFISTRKLAQHLNKDSKTISKRCSILAYLGLIRKLPESEIPSHMLKKAKEIARKSKHGKITSYYSIPIYDKVNLNFSQEKAIQYTELGFTVKGFSRELIYRSLGEEEANRVYPLMNGKAISENSLKVSSQVELIILQQIEDKCWTSEKEILDIIYSENGRKNYYEKLIKRILPEIVEKYSLVKIRLKKSIKLNFGIQINGYPFIITTNENLK